MEELLADLKSGWTAQNKEQLQCFVDRLASRLYKGKIVGIGAGRMGYSLRGFMMRLSHMGADCSFIGDTNVPAVSDDSTVIMNSSSGETPTNIIFARQAKEAGASLFLLTQNPESTIANLSDVVVTLPIIDSRQVMKTFPEQYTALLMDYVVVQLIQTMEISVETISKNHSVFE